MSKVALITGASRGIGRALSIGLAEKGYNIVVAAKSTKNDSKLPGTIYSVAEEVEQYGVKALPIKVDLRNDNDIEKLVERTENEFGKLDVLINNASALYWNSVNNTQMKNYDLINNINSRGTYMLSSLCIPLLKNSSDGAHVINQSPPLLSGTELQKMIKNKTAYMISKWGMTLSALGMAEEYRGKNIAFNALWPMTPIESYAVKNNNIGTEKHWRKTDIMVDAVLEILNENPNLFTGNELIDELYLRSKGIEDFSKYQCIQGEKPTYLTDLDKIII